MIILQILKILGITILVLLAVVLLLFFIVILTPVYYRVNGSISDKQQRGDISVRWLFGFLSFGWRYQDEQSGYELKICGFRIYPKKDKHSKAERKPYSEEDFFQENSGEEEINSVEKQEDIPLKMDSSDTGEKKEKDKHSPKSSFKKFSHGIQRAYSGVQTIKNDKRYKNALQKLTQVFIRLLKKIVPREMYLEGTYSLGSPDYTGLSFGILCIFPVAYTNCWKITPDFETDRMYINGYGRAKGKVVPFWALKACLELLFCEDIIYCCKKIKNALK